LAYHIKEDSFMKNFRIFVVAALALSLVASILGGCSPAEPSTKLKVVTTTSLLAQIVERVGSSMVDVVNIIPPAQCPGHFDVKPGDIQQLADADLFLMHGWQGEQFSEKLIASANNSDLTVVKIDVKVEDNDNWMTPPVQLAAVDKVVDALSQVDTKNSAAYQKAAAEYKGEIEAKDAEIKARLASANLKNVKVICDEQQAGFVQWTGLNIVATFGRPESLTPEVLKELLDKGREENVTLIIENLQSGHNAGAVIADELGCKRITLSNFPGGFDNTETWEKAIDYNVQLILEAISQ
jgi:zinc transport system substrate-binding protein